MDIGKQMNQLNNQMTLNRLLNTALFCRAKLMIINNKTLNNASNYNKASIGNLSSSNYLTNLDDEYLGETNMKWTEILKNRNGKHELLFKAEITPEIYSRFLNPNSQLYKWKSSLNSSKSDSLNSLITNRQSSESINSNRSLDLKSFKNTPKNLQTITKSPSSTLSIHNLSNGKLSDYSSSSSVSKFAYLKSPTYNSQLNLSTINESFINESSIFKTPDNSFLNLPKSSLSFNELKTANNIPFNSSKCLSLGVLANRNQINESFNYLYEKQNLTNEMNEESLNDLDDNKVNNPKRLHVHNIPFAYTEKELRELFKNYGPIIDAVVMRDKSGNSKGYGFITLSDARLAESSKVELGGHYRDGRKIIINDATPAKYALKTQNKQINA